MPSNGSTISAVIEMENDGQTTASSCDSLKRADIPFVPRSRLILVADDSSDDLLLLQRAFHTVGVINPIREVRSGEEAIGYLRGDGPYSDRVKYPFPGILLLDLHMPDGDGFKVLSWIRDKLPMAGLLIIVLSGAKEMRDVNRAYALGANSFLTKPGEPKELEQLIRSFHDYWILRNRPPALEQPA
jgi:CheY-like chemotaxis protein